MCENIEKCCRLCLDVDSDHVSILEDSVIHLHLKSCIPITVSANDNLPKAICVTCVAQLTEFYNFQLNARCSQDWLESSLQERKKTTETKTPIQPLPDSEYNSDSLLEFLNNTSNIEEYLTNLGKDDIPSIVNLFDKNNDNSMEAINKIVSNVKTKLPSPKKKELNKTMNSEVNMEIDILDSDIEIVKEILMKELEPKTRSNQIKSVFTCFGCKIKLENVQKLSQHLSICDNAQRTCIHCNSLFDSRQQMLRHRIVHQTSLPFTCNCGKHFNNKEKLMHHYKTCHMDYTSTMGCVHRCKECGKTFKERFQLYKHAKIHIMKSEEKICDICGHCFIGNEALSKHRREEHEKPDGTIYRCKICHYTSSDYKSMYTHVKKHTEKPASHGHLCESCGRSFASHATLMRHSQQHRTLKVHHKCNVCNKTFTDTKTRDEHASNHVEMVLCNKCGMFIICYKLDGHVCSS